MTQKVYKIRRKTDGLFSTGGSSPGFTTQGKTWGRKNHATCHISNIKSNMKYWKEMHPAATPHNPYKDCELVEYIITESKTEDINLDG
jgi:hypothetical protein